MISLRFWFQEQYLYSFSRKGVFYMQKVIYAKVPRNYFETKRFDVHLKEIDPYTLSTFEEIQQQGFMQNLDFYICVVKQNNKTFLFDAPQFIKDCIYQHGTARNPVTKQHIEEFAIVCFFKRTSPFYVVYRRKNCSHTAPLSPYYLERTFSRIRQTSILYALLRKIFKR